MPTNPQSECGHNFCNARAKPAMAARHFASKSTTHSTVQKSTSFTAGTLVVGGPKIQCVCECHCQGHSQNRLWRATCTWGKPKGIFECGFKSRWEQGLGLG